MQTDNNNGKLDAKLEQFLSSASSTDATDIGNTSVELTKQYYSANGEHCFHAYQNQTPVIFCKHRSSGHWYSVLSVSGQVN